jgi:uncharacterized membrane protein
MKLIRLAIIAGIIVTLLVTAAAYPALPDTVASHWNAAGQANGSMGKVTGILLVPFIMIALVALFAILPRIDPMKKNYEKFMNYYDGFILIFILYLLAIQVQIILWNLGYQISPNLTFPILFGILFIYLGFLLEHAEPNWFVGIRTPWTMSSTTVWKKTHELGGKLFKIAGVVSLFGVLAGKFALWFILVPALVVGIYTVVYSYLEFRKEMTTRDNPG